ncbi:MAG: hypothetical protein QMB71_07080, partial [Tolumonas sp.]
VDLAGSALYLLDFPESVDQYSGNKNPETGAQRYPEFVDDRFRSGAAIAAAITALGTEALYLCPACARIYQ